LAAGKKNPTIGIVGSVVFENRFSVGLEAKTAACMNGGGLVKRWWLNW
jgi:hypothetical protein